MKNRFAATFIFLAVFMALPLFAESRTQKIESMVQEESARKIKSALIRKPSLADASCGESKDSLLMVALKAQRDYDVIKLLLDAGVNPKKQNADGDNAVSYATKCGTSAKILDELITYDTVLPFQRKSRIMKKNNEGKCALDYASDKQELLDVINRYMGIVDKAKEDPVVEALPAAAATSAAPVVAAVAAQEPETKSEEPAEEKVEYAAQETPAQEEAVQEEAPAPLPEDNGVILQAAAAAAAASAKRPYKRVYLFEGIEAYDTYSAVQEKKPALIADPDKTGPNGRTLLQKAASQDDLDMIALLHESKADFNLADREGFTPLMYAARFAKRAETVAMLLSYGADIKAKNKFGLSAVEIAAADNKHAPVVEALLPRSPKADAKKALVAAVGLGRPNEVVQKFFDAGMNANEVYKGKTLLMYAAESNSHTDCIKFLLEKGADKTMLSSDWKDAYHFASQNPNLPHNDVYWSLNNAEKN
ncbi:MAG: ankyrin repeat domain-containing protein [Treponema sp.]|nr:ankyrin repeat domain-containing protein [Treponema sp.]